MTTLNQLKKVKTLEDLQALNIGNVYSDIGSRGGGVGFYSSDVAAHFNVPSEYLPGKFGAGCNYLGGGVRGSIFPSNFDQAITGAKATKLRELADACARVYESIENDNSMNDELDQDGETNWDAVATRAARRANIRSAY